MNKLKTGLLIGLTLFAYTNCQSVEERKAEIQKEIQRRANDKIPSPLKIPTPEEEAKIRLRNLMSEKQEQYFVENSIPLDSVIAFPAEIQNQIRKYSDSQEYVTKFYQKGIKPHVSKLYDKKNLVHLLACADNNIGPTQDNALNKKLSNFTEKIYYLDLKSKTKNKVEAINSLYEEYDNLEGKWFNKKGHEQDFVSLLEKYGSLEPYKKYAKLNVKYGTAISIREALYYDEKKYPFEIVQDEAKKYYENKIRTEIKNSIGEN